MGRAETPQVHFWDYPFEIGKAVVLREGSDVALIASGSRMVWEALAAGEELARQGIAARVLDLHPRIELSSEIITRARLPIDRMLEISVRR